MSEQLQVNDETLTAYFQQYRSDDQCGVIQGELLTKLEAGEKPGAFFSSLSRVDQFAILAWQLELSVDLAAERDISVSINVHNSLLEFDEDRHRLIELLSRFDNPVTLEFTETYPMPPMEIANPLLQEIRELGHHSALDDFGIGYNQMSLLMNYDFDSVKIDRSLSATLASNPERQRLMTLLFRYLDVLGKRHVVEGVEKEVVHRFLVETGFSTFQGFLFHCPSLVSDILSPHRELAAS